MQYPKELEKLINSFNEITKSGRKSSEKLALSFLNLSSKEQFKFINECNNASITIKQCPSCNNFTSNDGLCDICKNPNRSDDTLCVVSFPDYLMSIEKGNFYHGKYYILFNEITNYKLNEELNIDKLIKHIKNKTEIKEIILAMNPTIEGILMGKYIEEKLSKIFSKKISNLAIGIPMGSKIIYMDEITIENAFKNRK